MKISRFFKYVILLSVILFCTVFFSPAFITGWKNDGQKSVAIDGPEVLSPGELGVFTIPRHVKSVRWNVFPEVTYYVDTDGKTLVFSSSKECAYTIVAAFTESSLSIASAFVPSNDQEGLQLLVHQCTYKNQDVNPSPSPDPLPVPHPTTLQAWVQQNAPRDNSSVLNSYASIYAFVSSSIERGNIRTPSAAFTAIRSQIQAKGTSEPWRIFGNHFRVR